MPRRRSSVPRLPFLGLTNFILSLLNRHLDKVREGVPLRRSSGMVRSLQGIECPLQVFHSCLRQVTSQD